MKKINEKKIVKKSQKHVIWNSESSPDNPERLVHHFFIVGKLESEKVRENLIKTVSRKGIAQYPLTISWRRHFEKSGSKMDYLLINLEGVITPERISLCGFPYVIKKDEHLTEFPNGRQDLENYLRMEYKLS